ncbi:uncharacterized protein LOC134773309 [Penaeus indicus]|uniref:uncharacterized protein LOC134773309 n=1 Tax=Penaeus indicus TaxID=29960 RepID=UPI00300CBA40
MTRHINMPSVLPEEGDGAGQRDPQGSCGDIEAPHIAQEEGKHSPKIQWRSTDDQNQETSLQSKEKEKQSCIHGINNTEDQHVGSCNGYVLAHDPALLSNPKEKQDLEQPDDKTERTSVDMHDAKKDDRPPPLTSKGYVQCSAMTERLLSFQ